MTTSRVPRRGFLATAGAAIASLFVPLTERASGQEGEVLGEFEGSSTGGYVGFFRDSREAAKNNGTQIPASDEAEEPFTLDGKLYADRTWESSDPQLPQLEATRTTFDPDIPNGLTGEFDEEEGHMTAEGRIRVVDDEDRSVAFDLSATTGESGELTGSFEFDGTTVAVTLVDNEYEIENMENFGGGAIPDPDPELSNYLKIGLEFEPDDELVQALVGGDEEDDQANNESDGADDDSPGFGVLAGIAGLGGAGYLLRRLVTDRGADRE